MRKILMITISFFLLSKLWAQYPTAIGSSWEFAQTSPSNTIINAFNDVITKDTLVNGVIYQKTERTGEYYSPIFNIS